MAFKRIWHQQEVLAALDAGATVVVSGERLARATQLAYGEVRQARGERAWQRPDVLPYPRWIDRLYDSAVASVLGGAGPFPPRRLTASAAELLWQQVIRDSATAASLLQPAATARAASKAWDLGISHRMPLERIAASGEQDGETFAAWATEYKAMSRVQAALEDARLADWLATRLRERQLAAPERVIFAGFDGLTPQQRELVESLRAAGSRVEVLSPTDPRNVTAVRVACADPDAEMQVAARWARGLLERDPTTRIGIVVRDLEDRRGSLSRALDDALCPAHAQDTALAPAYDLSLGAPLSAAPVVRAALTLLGLLRRRLSFEQASLLLRTPFIAAAETERSGRAALELVLRARMSENLSLDNFVDFASSGGLPGLSLMLQAVRRIATELGRRRVPSAWAEMFRRTLLDSGWPGERSPDSREYQAVNRLLDLLGGLTALDPILGPVELDTTLSQLRRLADETLFQPAAEDAPVQVMGILDTAGLCFEHLWVMGLTDGAWPAAARPAAFLPLRLQREYGLPHASATVELEFAERLTGRLLTSGAKVIMSTARQQGDEVLRPSPLLVPLREQALADLNLADDLSQRKRLQGGYAVAAERYLDLQGPALRPAERAAGGTGLIRAQAACPFQAFGRYRLGAAALEEPSLGPDAKERGQLVHEVLQSLWGELGDQAALAALDAAGREALVQRHVTAALDRRRQEYPDIYTRPLAELEQSRLSALLRAWLEQDAVRQPFKVVEREAWHEVRLGPLKLSTRVDRVDELPDGGRVIFDYKTGEVKLKGWLDARPDEPQLPVYATAAGEKLAGLAFAALRPGNLGYLGLADRDGIAEGVVDFAAYRFPPPGVSDWGGLLEFWRQHLVALAEEYARGEARVAPKSQQTCERCHLTMLCRVHELDADLADAEGGGDDA